MKFRILIFTSIFIILINYVVFKVFSPEIFGESYQVTRYKLEVSKNYIKPHSVLFLGDSPALSEVAAESLSFPAYNLALPCGSLFEMFSLINRLDFKKLQTKIIVLSMHFKRSTNQEHCFEDMSLKPNLYNWGDLIYLLEDENSLSFSHFESKFSMLTNLILYKSYLHIEQLKSIDFKYVFNSLKAYPPKNIEKLLEIQNGRLEHFELDQFPFNLVDGKFDQEFKMHEFEINIFKKILNKLKDEKIALHYFHPLYSNTYSKGLSEKFLRSHDQFFQKIENEFSNFHYNDQIFFLPDTDFLDAVHPGKQGIVKYSNWMNSIIPRLIKSEK